MEMITTGNDDPRKHTLIIFPDICGFLFESHALQLFQLILSFSFRVIRFVPLFHTILLENIYGHILLFLVKQILNFLGSESKKV